MTKTIWLLAMVAACGDNVAGPASVAPPMPSYRVDGMALEDGPAPIACDTRYTVPSGVYDCPTVEVEAGHYQTTCPVALAHDAELVHDQWIDDHGRTIEDSFTNDIHYVVTTTYSYDDFGLHEMFQYDNRGADLEHMLVQSRNEVGNPVSATDEILWPTSGPLQMAISYSYDDSARLTDMDRVFTNGTGFFDDWSVGYDDAENRREISILWGTWPGSGPSSTGGFFEQLDSLGRVSEVTVTGSNPTQVVDYSYDEIGRQSRIIATTDGRVVTTDMFYECP